MSTCQKEWLRNKKYTKMEKDDRLGNSKGYNADMAHVARNLDHQRTKLFFCTDTS